jgi:hypothetical protein
VKKNKSNVQKIYLMQERNIYSLINIIPSIAASNALLVSSRNSSEAAIKPREFSLSSSQNNNYKMISHVVVKNHLFHTSSNHHKQHLHYLLKCKWSITFVS